MPVEQAKQTFLGRIFINEEPLILLPAEFEKDRDQTLTQILDSLGSVESRKITVRAILERHFGLDDGRTHDLKALSKEFHLNIERVRKIEQRAFSMLRHPSRGRFLSLYAHLPQDSLGRVLWQADFGCQIQQQLSPLSLPDLNPEEIYPVAYLKIETPSLVKGWEEICFLPVSLLLRHPASQTPEVLFDLKDTLEALRS